MLGKWVFKEVFESTLNLRYSVSRHGTTDDDFRTFRNLVDAIGQYNEFEPEDIRIAFEDFDELVPRAYYNEGNSNNGQRLYSLEIGREGSPVIYVTFSGHVEQIDKIEKLFPAIKKIMGTIAHADEMTYEREAGYFDSLEIRLWWD